MAEVMLLSATGVARVLPRAAAVAGDEVKPLFGRQPDRWQPMGGEV